MLQERFLYYPAKAVIEDVVSDRLVAWPTKEAFRGLADEPPATARGTAIVFHGNAGHAGHRAFCAAALKRLGLRVDASWWREAIDFLLTPSGPE